VARSARKRRKRRPDFTPPPGQTPKPEPAAEPTPARRRPSGSERPPAPWGNFPLSEIVILIAIVLLFAGFFVDPPRGPVMVGAGLALGSLAGLEISLREHLAGYRSHTLLLAGAVGVAVIGVLFVFGPPAIPPLARVAAGIAAFSLAAWGLTGLFRRRSGGVAFKTRA
jgi:hypothetical protein